MDIPALRLVDVLCLLFPERKIAIIQFADQFYAGREKRMGEYLVERGIITQEELRLAVLQQKAEMGRLDAVDADELGRIRSDIQARFAASFEEMTIFANRGGRP